MSTEAVSKEKQLRLISRVWPKSLFEDIALIKFYTSIGFAINDVTVNFTMDHMRIEVFQISGKSKVVLKKWPETQDGLLSLLREVAGNEIIDKQLKPNYQ